MASLKDALDMIRRAAEGDGTKPGRISPEDLKVMHRVTADQRASGFQARMPKAGQPGPMFTLANQDGAAVSSAALVARGPLVMSFFRGRW
jgi:prolyl-tRNA editing enzyme YbaK/EbsC (Cys-tRNA(Pro) deacylase)